MRLTRRRPGWESVDQVQFRATRLQRLSQSWFSRSRLSTVAPSLSCDPPTPRQPRGRDGAYTPATGARYRATRLKRLSQSWFSRSRLSTVAPSLSSDPPTPRQPRGRDGAYTAATGARYTPPLASSPQTIRAILLATATRTSIGGWRASMRPSPEPAGTPLRAAQRATALAPMISKRRSERPPTLEVLPSRSLPPLER